MKLGNMFIKKGTELNGEAYEDNFFITGFETFEELQKFFEDFDETAPTKMFTSTLKMLESNVLNYMTEHKNFNYFYIEEDGDGFNNLCYINTKYNGIQAFKIVESEDLL